MTTLYERLLAKTGKTHEEVQDSLKAEREERQRLAMHEATRPKPELEQSIATHLFIEALIEVFERHNLSVTVSGIRPLDEEDIDHLRRLDPVLNPTFPFTRIPYR